MEEGIMISAAQDQYVSRVISDLQEVPSYVQLVNRWKEVAPQVTWQIFLGDPRQRKESQEVHLPVEEVRIYEEAASVSLIIHRQCTLRLPFDIGLVMVFSGRKARVYVQTISGPHGSFWTCPTGRIKLDVQPLPGAKPSATGELITQCILKRVRIQVHAETVLRELRVMPEPRRIDKDTSQLKGYALMGYSLFLALRSQDSDTPLFSARVINLRVTRIESPYQNTITFSIPKKQDKTSTTAPLPFIIPGSVLRPDEPDQLKLVTDILLYDQEDRIMWSRSGWLFPKRHPAFPDKWEACLLAEDYFWASFAFEERRKQGHTRLHDVSLVVPLARINSWSKTRYKLHDVAMCVIDFEDMLAT